MTYFGFLVRFLFVPIVAFASLLIWETRRGKTLPAALRGWSPVVALSILIGVAVVYTTPWDNYLVATRVWWYDPAKVSGIVFGWVPLEEYIFFAVQPVPIGLWLLLLARWIPSAPPVDQVPLRAVLLGVAAVWVVMLIVLVAGWQPGTYLALELVWALPPIMLQIWFGLDILVRHRRLVLLTIIPATLYLSAADHLAIRIGVWTINPEQSLNVFLGTHLPLEEFVFFLLTTTLVTFGLVLALASESWGRLRGQTLVGSRD